MQRTANILVLMGGPDAEREVSIMSGREVTDALRSTNRFHILDRVIDRPTLGELADMAAHAQCEVIFPVLHGTWGEGGELQEMLMEIGLPFVGSDCTASTLAMDKLVTKSMLREADASVLMPNSAAIEPNDACPIDPPLVLKPINDGSSVDLRICKKNAMQVAEARRELHAKRSRLMVEQYIKGREITAGILHGRPLPLIEIIPAVAYYDYEAKYTRDDTQYVVDPNLPPGIASEITRVALLAFEVLGCRDVARVDFILDERGPWFLEINTMPGFTTHSLVPMAARAVGKDMPMVCAELVEAALVRRTEMKHSEPRRATKEVVL